MIRVLIADDHMVVREGIQRILSRAVDIKVRGEAATGTEVLRKVAQAPYDVVVLDLTLPDMSGFMVLDRLQDEHPDVAVLVLSMLPEREYAVRVLQKGGAGYLSKESVGHCLVEAVRTVAAGEQYITSSVGRTLAMWIDQGTQRPLHEKLSEREFEVMRRIATGEVQREIAEALSISPKTVSTYRARILEKLQLRTDVDIARYALFNGLVTN